jgi:hypothetical protein
MSEQEEKPLLTFALVGYNQERFIREAVEGAFAQTYSPLEIILSDDCSNDRTFEIMRVMAAAYLGPHRVVLNRNVVNCGIGGHINRVMELVHGELVVIAAADDISLPERVQVVCQAWQSDGKRATTVYSRFIRINEAGAPLGAPPSRMAPRLPVPLMAQSAVPCEYLRTIKPAADGCVNAWSPRLFSLFGPLPANLVIEDHAITFRSVLAGRILLVDLPLVKYRQHRENLWNRTRPRTTSIASIREEERRSQNAVQRWVVLYDGFLADLETARAKGLLSEEEYGRSRSEGQRTRKAFELQARYFTSGLWMKTCILWRLHRMNAALVSWRPLLRRWMPISLVLITKLGLGHLRASAQFLKPRRPAAKAETS